MIDLRSDTVTRPDEAMRRAAMEATVGDDVHGDDPTVAELERRAADLVGKDAALFVPSGTMGNQIAARVHTTRGDEVLVDVESHMYKWELGGLAELSNLQVRTYDGDELGVPGEAALREGIIDADSHRSGTGLLCLENTHNSRGGVAAGIDAMETASMVAGEYDITVHLDGARVFNAAVALGVDVTEITDTVDSVMFCLSKGLGAPIGSILAGNASFIERARRIRKLFGGGMRQVGIIAAPGLCALENVDALESDHEHAQTLASGLADIEGFEVMEPETNIVIVDVSSVGSPDFVRERCVSAGVDVSPFGESTIRLCTHRDVDAESIDEAVERLLNEFSGDP